MKIVCLGDSCTYGQNVRADQAWPAVLARITGHDVRNEGVCGDTTRLGLERWKYAVGLHNPDVVVLQFGHNDANLWDGNERVAEDAYVANLKEMAARARPDRTLILRPHQGRGVDEAYNERLRAYSWRLRGRGLEPPDPMFLLDDGYGVHPDVIGHERYAELVAGWL